MNLGAMMKSFCTILLACGLFIPPQANASSDTETYVATGAALEKYTSAKRPDGKSFSLTSQKTTLTLGQTWRADHLFFGIEAKLSGSVWGYEYSTRWTAPPKSIPFEISEGACGGCAYPGPQETTTVSNPYLLSIDEKYRYKFENNYGVDIASRFGARSGSFEFFGKVGGGLRSFKLTETYNNSGDDICSEYIQTTYYQNPYPGEVTSQSYLTQCSVHERGSITTNSTDRIAPALIVGIGADYYFGRTFVRGEIELDHAFLSDMKATKISQGLTAMSASVSFGIDL
jgi:hypothetical protein